MFRDNQQSRGIKFIPAIIFTSFASSAAICPGAILDGAINGPLPAFSLPAFSLPSADGDDVAADDADDADAAVDADAGVCFPFDLDRNRGGSESATRCPMPLKELCGGLGVELRPLVGLATITSRVGSTDFEVARSFFDGFPTEVEDARFDVGCASAAALAELVLSRGLREELLLLARAFAAGGCAEGSRLAALGFAAALGSEAARFVSNFSGCGVGSSFGVEFSFFCSRTAFRLASSAALTFVWSAFKNLFLALILGLLGGGGGPWCGGGAMPAGTGSGPGGPLVGSIIMSSRMVLVAALPCVRSPFAVFLTGTIFTAFPPPTPTIIGVAPGPGGPGGGWLLPCETSMGWLPSCPCFPCISNSVSFATYDWSTVELCAPRWLAIVLAIPILFCATACLCSANTFAVSSPASCMWSFYC